MVEVLPTAKLWDNPQYQVLGAVVLVVALLLFGLYKFWSKYQDWQTSEAAIQREWQTVQNKLREDAQAKRDAEYRNFLRERDAEQCRQNEAQMKILENMSAQVQAVVLELREHDTWVRAAVPAAMRQRKDGE